MNVTALEVDLSLLAATFLDVRAWNPSLHQSLELDYLRVKRVITTRGISFLIKDMPDGGKVLDKALSEGRINSDHLPHTFGKRVNSASRIFLNTLFRMIFDDTGCIRESIDPNAVFFLRQVLYLFKNLKNKCSDENTALAIDEFAEIEGRMRKPTCSWDLDQFDPSRLISVSDEYRAHSDLVSYKDTISLKLLSKFQGVCDVVTSMFPPLNTLELNPGHGPGAVSDLQTGKDKYSFPTWSNKLESMFPMTSYAMHNVCSEVFDYCGFRNIEVPCQLFAVPKTPLKPRLIAAEPVSHQYCQKALMRWIRDSLPDPLRYSINFTNQEPSQSAVLSASKDGQLASVDLSSASDRLSCWLVERVFRVHPELLYALHASRTRVIKNHSGLGSWKYLLLRKFSHQGSSVTFPIQTIVYTYACIASVLFSENLGPTSRNILKACKEIRVFGDDIILPSHAAKYLVELLTYLGLKVNMGKTHTTGFFRESCGMDAFRGVDVTPLYVSNLGLGENPIELVSWTQVCNNAYRKGLWFLSDYMVTCMRKYANLIPVTNLDLGCISLFTYQAGFAFSGRRQMCKHLHRPRILALQVAARTAQGERSNSQNLLQYFVEEPEPTTKWVSGYSMSRRFKIKKRWVHILKA